MTQYLITDMHYMSPFLVKVCNRPSNADTLITNNWDSTVTPTDMVICLGDICTHNEREVHEKFIIPRPGRKILVRGNHDHKSNQWYLEHGWDFVCDGLYITAFNKRLLFTHIPQLNAGGYDTYLNIHGHFHNNPWIEKERYLAELRCSRHRLLACEYHGYGPIKLGRYLAIVENKYSPPKFIGTKYIENRLYMKVQHTQNDKVEAVVNKEQQNCITKQ